RARERPNLYRRSRHPARREVVECVAGQVNREESAEFGTPRPRFEDHPPAQREGNLGRGVEEDENREPAADPGEVGGHGRPTDGPEEKEKRREPGEEERDPQASPPRRTAGGLGGLRRLVQFQLRPGGHGSVLFPRGGLRLREG